MNRAVIMVLDSFGIGGASDAESFGDQGANTFLHIAEACAAGQANEARSGHLDLPNLAAMGLGHAGHASCGQWAPGFRSDVEVKNAGWGYAQELSSGKDTPSGHWEITGVPVLFDWGYFSKLHDTFPENIIDELVRRTGIPGILANCHASGTQVLEDFGEQHMQTGKPICYTSADSVMQIAAHEETFGLDRLMEVCEVARELVNDYNIGRVIARPFLGDKPGEFYRTGNRRDLSVPPPSDTLLDNLVSAGGEVVSIGKIADIYAHRGISRKFKAHGLDDLIDATLAVLAEPEGAQAQLVFTNLVDFDMVFGHRRNVAGYAAALEQFDRRLPEIQAGLRPGDLLILTADHGCDPTWKGTDHTRENIPVLVWGPDFRSMKIGCCETFADIGQSLAQYFQLPELEYGTSFLDEPL